MKFQTLKFYVLAVLTLSTVARPTVAPAETLYGITIGGQELITIDTATGAGTLVGPLGSAMDGFGLGVRSGKLYTYDQNADCIQQLDPATGQTLATIDIGLNVTGEGALDFRSDGVGFLSTSFAFYQFDITAPNSALVNNNIGIIIDGLAFDASGVLYGISSSGGNISISPKLYTIVPATGITTLVGDTFLPGDNGSGGLAFACDGTLYAALWFANQNTSKLYTISKTTGAATLVGDIGFVNVSGITFGPCCVPAPTNMALWLPLDEPSGTTSYNLAPGSINGEYVVGTTVNNGYVLRSRCFDGNSQYVYVPYYSDINITTGDLSIDAWVKRGQGDTGVREIVFHRSWGPSAQGYALSLNNGVLTFIMSSGSGSSTSQTIASGQTVPPDGNWHFVAVTVARTVSNGGMLYMDDSLPIPFSPLSDSYSLANGSDLLVGAASVGPIPSLGFFIGCIDEVEIFTRALTEPEINSIFSSGSAGKCKPACVDHTPPVITSCPTNRTLFPDFGCIVYVPDMTGEVVASDNSSAITVVQNPAAGTFFFGTGPHPVVFTVCDACTNCVTCTNYVTLDCIPPGPIVINKLNTNVVISWPGTGTLQSSTNLNPPINWTDITTNSPYTNPTTSGQKFFRLRK